MFKTLLVGGRFGVYLVNAFGAEHPKVSAFTKMGGGPPGFVDRQDGPEICEWQIFPEGPNQV